MPNNENASYFCPWMHNCAMKHACPIAIQYENMTGNAGFAETNNLGHRFPDGPQGPGMQPYHQSPQHYSPQHYSPQHYSPYHYGHYGQYGPYHPGPYYPMPYIFNPYPQYHQYPQYPQHPMYPQYPYHAPRPYVEEDIFGEDGEQAQQVGS